MFIKGKCAIYIGKNLRVYENSTVIFVLCTWRSNLFGKDAVDRGPTEGSELPSVASVSRLPTLAADFPTMSISMLTEPWLFGDPRELFTELKLLSGR